MGLLGRAGIFLRRGHTARRDTVQDATAPPARAAPSGLDRVLGRCARKAVLTVVYLLCVLLFSEGVSRLFLSTYFDRVQNNDDVSWRLRWLARQHRKSRPPQMYYAFDDYHPTRGWAVKPNVRDLPVFGPGEVVNSNSEGVRGRREYADPKPPAVTRLLAFGDSLTFGDEVSDDETYSTYLDERLPGTEVVNLGVHGYGHDQMLLYLKEVGARYQPDVVLLGFVSIDVERNLLSFRDFAKPRFDLRGDRLVLRNVPVPSPRQVRAREPFRSKFADLLALLYQHWRWRSGRNDAAKEQVTAAILDEFRRTVVGMGATPVFVYLPVQGELDTPQGEMLREEHFFVRYCRQRSMLCLNLRPHFLSRLHQGAVFKTVGHWSPAGHRIAAEEIRAYLAERKILPAAN